ncbi:MAG: hypothetical protein AAF721_04955 [Myxococcota bacterium]
MHSLSLDLERQLDALERKRDGFLKQLEGTGDPRAQRRYLSLIASVEDRIGSKRLALAATPDRRGGAPIGCLEFGELCEVMIVGGDSEDDGVEVSFEVGRDEFEDAPTKIFRWPTAPYPIVEDRFVHSA